VYDKGQRDIRRKLSILTYATEIGKAGLIRMLATTGKERHPEFPDVPTTAELGYPAMNIVWWAGFAGPPNMSSNIIDIWEKALQEMVKDPAYVSQATKMGNMVFYLNSRQLREHVRKEIEELNELYAVK
jgi:tripartite-type tricarboxylate transporter receptor subunit TctC